MGTPKQRLYDFVIVGGGAAGLTAALYSSRREMKTLIISQDVGGQAATTPDIENYPGIVFSHGVDLMETFKKQAEHFGAELVFDSVIKIESLMTAVLLSTRTHLLSKQKRCCWHLDCRTGTWRFQEKKK